MSRMIYDAIVIGGGPGGSSAATYLARAGRRVLLLEKEHFPRFHIGESLLPYNRWIFDEMGVLPALESAGFTTKYGAQFHLGNKSKGVKFVFRNGRFTREPVAFQVERAKFDHLLLQHAERSGAEVREGWSVRRFESSDREVRVESAKGDDPSEIFSGRFLVDASGRANLTGNQENLRVPHPALQKIAIFAQFSGVRVDDGEKAGDTVIIRLENKWFWLIPLSPDKVSIGLVMDRKEFAELKKTPEAILNLMCGSSAAIAERTRGAHRLTPVQTTTDFSYRNRRFVGHRLLRIGDAAGFMDPIFSAGVYLAMFSGKLAAEAVMTSLDANDDGKRRLRKYEKRLLTSMRFYWEMVENFYTTPFMEVFLEPREKFHLPAAVNAVLAGELDGGWKMRWRMRIFFWLVKLQARYPLVPRIKSFN